MKLTPVTNIRRFISIDGTTILHIHRGLDAYRVNYSLADFAIQSRVLVKGYPNLNRTQA